MESEYIVTHKISKDTTKTEKFSGDEIRLMIGGIYYAEIKDSISSRKKQYREFRKKWAVLRGESKWEKK